MGLVLHRSRKVSLRLVAALLAGLTLTLAPTSPSRADDAGAGSDPRAVAAPSWWFKPALAPYKAKRDARLARCKHRWCKRVARENYRYRKSLVKRPFYWAPMINQDGSVARWNPCDRITYLVDLSGAAVVNGRTAQEDWDWALTRFRAATGLDLGPASSTDTVNISVGWRSVPDQIWAGSDYTSAWTTATTPPGVRQALWSSIWINSAYDTITDRRETLMHELAHAAGLGHVDDPRSIMKSGGSTLASAMLEYSPGDRAGLWAMGAGGGCWQDSGNAESGPTPPDEGGTGPLK